MNNDCQLPARGITDNLLNIYNGRKKNPIYTPILQKAFSDTPGLYFKIMVKTSDFEEKHFAIFKTLCVYYLNTMMTAVPEAAPSKGCLE